MFNCCGKEERLSEVHCCSMHPLSPSCKGCMWKSCQWYVSFAVSTPIRFQGDEGTEAVIHGARLHFNEMSSTNVMLKLDFMNTFKSSHRDCKVPLETLHTELTRIQDGRYNAVDLTSPGLVTPYRSFTA